MCGRLPVFVFVAVLLVTSTIATKSAVSLRISATTPEPVRRLISYADVSIKEKKVASAEEERGGGTVGASAATRTGGGGAIPTSNNQATDGEMVTVTTYSNNGRLQRFMRWWKRLISGKTEASTSSRRLRSMY
ncbi:hypothetical protein V7S43_015824 [Phytophthora oleae]|uniref:RxLR effector protein n=1 Tax=Phytophthora oleae TaxID=2107226 RepID=A0ABD3F0V3_9STRA